MESVDPRRVFALLVDPSILVEIRRTRMKHMGVEPSGAYGDPARVREELDYARALYAKHPEWTVLDISGKAIEETAALILERYRARFETNGGSAKGAESSAARAPAAAKTLPGAAPAPTPAPGKPKRSAKAKG
jgi:hypothetical protein